MSERTVLLVGALMGLLAVGAGSLGAHGLEGLILPDQASSFGTGVEYHMYHALAVLACAGFVARFRLVVTIAVICFAAGTLVFSGALYALALTGASFLGAIAAFGGTLLLMGWLALVAGFWIRGEKALVLLPSVEPTTPTRPTPIA